MSLSLLTAAAETPQRTALVVAGEELSYAELATRVRRWLPALRRRTSGAPRVALIGDSDLATLTALYALMELGRAVVLLHPRWSEGEKKHMLEACAPLVELDPGSLEEDTCASSGDDLDPPPEDERCLAVVPTSGSSARPKGVVLSRRAFVAAAQASAANLGWQDEDRWLLSLPVAHVGGLSILTRCLHGRSTVVVHRGVRFDAAKVAHIVETERITLVSLVPTTLHRLLTLRPRWDPPPRLRAMLVGGAAAPSELLETAAARRWPVLVTYGSTETCSQAATQPYGTAPRGDGGCGPPLPGTEIRITDGVIEVRGPQLMTGYLPPGGEPITEDGWLRTEDLGRLDKEGRLHVFGRRDDVVVSGGENVRLAEVEGAFASHPAITAACAFAVDDEEWGQAVAIALVAASDPPADEELESHLEPRLARFKTPRRIAYLKELAYLASGKVDRHETAARARAKLRSFPEDLRR